VADFDLINGDADGIFSLLQLRQVEPRPDAELVTGVKRDIKLFPRIADRAVAGDRITALDISMAKNTAGLVQVLEAGADVLYIDHHQTGDIPESDALTVLTSDAKESCTAFLTDGYLKGAKSAWAICGAYGDNFQGLAARIAKARGLDVPMGRLRELGELVNYNAYGLTVDDLHFHPAELYRILLDYPGPVEFLEDDHPAFETLKAGYHSDWDIAQSARELDVSDAGQILALPAKPASNRISGLFGNALVDEEPEKAFAVLTELEGETIAYRVSIRAPRGRSTGSAADLASQFGGGGRAAAAGIDHLPSSDLEDFSKAFRKAFARDD
jgi:hypothetical protein